MLFKGRRELLQQLPRQVEGFVHGFHPAGTGASAFRVSSFTWGSHGTPGPVLPPSVS